MSLGIVRIDDALGVARSRGASDVHLAPGAPPSLRIDGRLVALDGAPLDEGSLRAFLARMLPAEALARLDASGAADAAVVRGAGAPYRIHAFRSLGGVRAAVRLLAERIPALDRLGIPDAVQRLVARHAGLVLFTGPTGSGKTTALAALVDRINRESERTIVTIEDPIEYVHRSVRSLIAHVEIGRDADGYAEALRDVLRADPDVIVVGELRDRDAMAAALTAAETGHLVLATAHSHDAAHAVDRIVDAFPADAHAHVRGRLAAVLAGITAVRLVARREGRGRRLAAEVLIATEGVRALVREGKSHQLRNAIVTGRSAGMQTLEAHLSELVVRGEVTLDAARAVANRPTDVQSLEAAS